MASEKLPILMYHNITASDGNGLTIGVADFEAQCAYLAGKGYKTYHFSELLQIGKLEAKKNCVITFDDAYVNQLKFAVPILEKYQLKATFFVPMGFIGTTDAWNTGKLNVMSAAQLKGLPSATIELAYHSFQHGKFHEMPQDEVSKDVQKAREAAKVHGLNVTPVLAYPYGKFPRRNPHKARFKAQLEALDIELGLRIGNRIEAFPFKNPYEINRIDVKGEWSLLKFKRKLRMGKFF